MISQKGLENAHHGGLILLFYGLKFVFIVALLLSQQKKKKNLNQGIVFKNTPQQPIRFTFCAAF